MSAENPSLSTTLSDESRTLESGEREFTLDVRTQDLEVNMGPQHPATHGVMRILIRADGELVTGAQPHLGYLLGALVTGQQRFSMPLKKGMLVGLQAEGATTILAGLRFALTTKAAAQLT